MTHTLTVPGTNCVFDFSIIGAALSQCLQQQNLRVSQKLGSVTTESRYCTVFSVSLRKVFHISCTIRSPSTPNYTPITPSSKSRMIADFRTTYICSITPLTYQLIPQSINFSLLTGVTISWTGCRGCSFCVGNVLQVVGRPI